MNSGSLAETKASEYLKKEGYAIVARNWKTPRCEIDIVAMKNKTVFLVEVKYRKQSAQGAGLEYITAKKLAQMRFAAEIWQQTSGYSGDIRLMALELGGDSYDVTNMVEIY